MFKNRLLRGIFQLKSYRQQQGDGKISSGKIHEGRTESHEQLFLHANWEQQTKESAVVDGTSCCVILECLVT